MFMYKDAHHFIYYQTLELILLSNNKRTGKYILIPYYGIVHCYSNQHYVITGKALGI